MSTNQFVVFTGKFSEPLVKLQDSNNGHQIPEMQNAVEWLQFGISYSYKTL